MNPNPPGHADVLRCSVATLLNSFREALVAVQPIADNLLINWRDDNQSRDWERVADALFESMVAAPIRATPVLANFAALAAYDIDRVDYRGASWLSLGVERGRERAFIRLTSQHSPFDGAHVAHIDPESLATVSRTTISWSEMPQVELACQTSEGVVCVPEVAAEE